MSNEGERALSHAVRAPVVLRYVGELSLVVGLAALVPATGAMLFGEFHLIVPYGAAGLALLGLGAMARRMPTPSALQRNEAIVITVAVFVLSPIVMSGPLVYEGIPWIDAIFESVSGVTTTGLSTLPSVENRSQTFLLTRAWMQWMGGLGFVVMFVALALEAGFATRRLGLQSSDPAHIVPSMHARARRVLAVYSSLTALGIVALLILGASIFDAVVYTFSAISTGGFSPRDTSLASLDPQLQCGVLGLSMLGAVSLLLFSDFARGNWKHLRDDPEARALVYCVVAGAGLLIGLTRLAGLSGEVSLTDLALMTVSAQTTAGFATISPGDLPGSAQAILLGSMVIGGAQGSTAGGVKLYRVLVMVRLVQWFVTRTRLPDDAVSTPTLSNHRIESADLLSAAAFISLFVVVILGSWLCFLAYGYPPLDSLFEVVSAAGTVGLSVGISGPDLEPLLKGILTFDMLLGRLEVLAVLIFLSPRTWVGRRAV